MNRRPLRPEAGRPRPVRGRWTLFGVCLSLITAFGLLAALGRADDATLNPAIPSDHSKALNKLAQYLEAPGNVAGRLLEDVHYYHPGIHDDVWLPMPPVRKMETAYLAAERAGKGGGERFLALLSKAMAQQYESAGKSQALLAFVAKADAVEPVKFAELDRTKESALAPLSPKEKAAVDALAEYSEGGGIGPRAALVEYLGLSTEEAYDIMRTSGSPKEILHTAIQVVPEARRFAVLQNLIGEVERSYESARVVEEFGPYRKPKDLAIVEEPFQFQRDPSDPRPWRPEDGPRPPDLGGIGSRPGEEPKPPPPGSAEAWRLDGLKDYRSFVEREYKAPTPGPFPEAIKSRKGFGGVVFGNEVTDDGLPAPVSLGWEADPKDGSVGTLTCKFDKTAAALAGVRQEEACAAYRIIYAGVRAADPTPGKDGAKADLAIVPWDKGEAIGLVGVQEGVEYFDCGPEGFLHAGERRKVVMHPAIADLKLGWTVLLCDVIPDRNLRAPVIQYVTKAGGEEKADEMRRIWDEARFAGWKFCDVPMRVSVEDGALVVVRPKEAGSDFPAEVRESCFITFNAYNQSGLIKGSGEAFYPLVPLLTEASPDYKRLNDFAKVLAVVRWAKARGADFPKPPPAPPSAPWGGSLIITGAGAVPAPDFEPRQANKELQDKVRLRLAVLCLTAAPELRRLEQTWGRQADDLLKSDALLQKATEFRTALKRLDQMDGQLDDPEWVAGLLATSPDDKAKQKIGSFQKELGAGQEALDKAKAGSAEEKEARERLTRLKKERRDYLSATFPKARDLVAEAEGLRKKGETAAKELVEMLDKLGDPMSEFVDIVRKARPDDRKSLDDMQAEFEAAKRKQEAARTKSEALKNRHEALRKEQIRLEDEFFDTPTAADALVAFKKEHQTEFENFKADLADSEAAADAAAAAVLEVQRRRREALEKLCPELRYWTELHGRLSVLGFRDLLGEP